MSTTFKLLFLAILAIAVLGGRLPTTILPPPDADTGWQVWSLAAADDADGDDGTYNNDENEDDEDDDGDDGTCDKDDDKDKDVDNSGAYYKDRPVIRQY